MFCAFQLAVQAPRGMKLRPGIWNNSRGLGETLDGSEFENENRAQKILSSGYVFGMLRN